MFSGNYFRNFRLIRRKYCSLYAPEISLAFGNANSLCLHAISTALSFASLPTAIFYICMSSLRRPKSFSASVVCFGMKPRTPRGMMCSFHLMF